VVIKQLQLLAPEQSYTSASSVNIIKSRRKTFLSLLSVTHLSHLV
jgi:hypothetical protein